MKIAIIAPFKNTEKGIAIYSELLLKSLLKKEMNVDYVGYKLGSYLSMLKLIYKLKSYDIIHLQHEYGLFGKITGEFFIPLIGILGIFFKKKIIVTMHSIYPKKHLPQSRYIFLSRIRKLVFYFQTKLIIIFSKKIIVHTDFLAKLLKKEYNINKSQIVVIPQGVNENMVRFNKKISKKKLGLSGNVYLVMGNMGNIKGTDIIVKLAKSIGRTILIAGHSNFKSNVRYLKKIQKFIDSHNLKNIVIFDKTEMDSNNKLWGVYFSAADLVILPYRRMASSGIFIDAMGSRKPVVGSNLRYLSEVSKKYGCVKVVKKIKDYPKIIKEAMKELKKMELEAERFARDNGLKKISDSYKILYNSI